MFRPSNTKKLAVGVTSFAGAFAGGTGNLNNKSASEFFPQQTFDTIHHSVKDHIDRSTFDLEKESAVPHSKDPLLRNPFVFLRKDDDENSVATALSELSDGSYESDPLLHHGLELVRTQMQSFFDEPITVLEGECAKEIVFNNLNKMGRHPTIVKVQNLSAQHKDELLTEALINIQSEGMMNEFHQLMEKKRTEKALLDAIPATETLPAAQPEPAVLQEEPSNDSYVHYSNKAVVRASSWAALQTMFPCSLCRDVLAAPVALTCGCNFCYSCMNDYKCHASKVSSKSIIFAYEDDCIHDCPHCKQLFDSMVYERAFDQLIVDSIHDLPKGSYTMEEYTDWVERRTVHEDALRAKQAKEKALKDAGEETRQSRRAEEEEWEEFKAYAVPVVMFLMMAMVAVYRSYATAKK
jgi:hypothetical protein